MVRNYNLDDILNKNNSRNLRNTNKHTYNCAGYALGTYSWYVPCNNEGDNLWSLFQEMATNIDDEDDLDNIYQHIYEIAHTTLMRDFAHRNIRPIWDIKDCKENEMIFAFRFCLFDFHFIKLGKNGVWYQKHGGCKEIETLTADEVLHDIWSNGIDDYDSDIYLYAMSL